MCILEQHVLNMLRARAGQAEGLRLVVDHPVVDLAGGVVARVTGTEQWATHAGLESLHGGLVQDCVCASGW